MEKYVVVINPAPIKDWRHKHLAVKVEAESEEEAQTKAWEEIRWAHAGYEPIFMKVAKGGAATKLWNEYASPPLTAKTEKIGHE